jgi:carbonic anhydrase/acetyltransferase-like protein (isoleucine patch superfamily)
MILEHGGAVPVIDPTARGAPNAMICGDVTIGPNCSIGFGAVLTAESGSIVWGAHCVVMDTAVLRGVRGNPVTIGDNVLVGPRAYLTGCTVADNVFLATGATVFNGARIGARAEVRINGTVHLRTVLPEDAVVPLNWIAGETQPGFSLLISMMRSGRFRKLSTFPAMSSGSTARRRVRALCRM